MGEVEVPAKAVRHCMNGPKARIGEGKTGIQAREHHLPPQGKIAGVLHGFFKIPSDKTDRFEGMEIG